MPRHHHVAPPDADEWPTCVRLALALEFAGAPAFMIVAARYGGYHDYLSKVATPEVLLLDHARRYKLPTIVEGVLEGRWDATKEESDRWAASADGQQTLGMLARRNPKMARKLGHRPDPMRSRRN